MKLLDDLLLANWVEFIDGVQNEEGEWIKINSKEYLIRRKAILEEMKNAKEDYQANQVSNQD